MLGRDGIAGAICLALSLGLLVLTIGLPQPALVPVGPAFYPRIVLVAMAILSALLLAQDLAARRRLAADTASDAPRPDYRLVAQSFAAFGAYVGLLPVVGYRVATVLFVAVLQALLDPPKTLRHWLRIAAIAVGTSIITHVVFEQYLLVLLPRGRLTGF